MTKNSDRILDDIRREYDRLQLANRTRLEERKQEIFEKIPAYKALLQNTRRTELSALYQKLAMSEDAEDRGSNDREVLMDKESLRKKKESLLVEAGYPADYLSGIWACKDCEDTGYLRDEYGARSIRCKCFTKKLTQRLSEESGLSELLKTENFEHLSLDYYQGEDLENFSRALELCRKFAANPKDGYKNFFFYGNIGTGKSFLSCCVAKELLDKGLEVVYYSAGRLFDRLAAAKNAGRSDQEEDAGAVRSMIYECDLLILDDLGTEWFNNFVFSELFSLINERILKEKPTIISTNLSLTDLKRIYSERLFSRITSNYLICKFTGSDIRREKARQRQEDQN